MVWFLRWYLCPQAQEEVLHLVVDAFKTCPYDGCFEAATECHSSGMCSAPQTPLLLRQRYTILLMKRHRRRHHLAGTRTPARRSLNRHPRCTTRTLDGRSSTMTAEWRSRLGTR